MPILGPREEREDKCWFIDPTVATIKKPTSSSVLSVLRAVTGNVTLLLAFVAGLALGEASASSSTVDRSAIRAGSGKTVPSHVVWATATVTLDGGEGRSVQTASGGWSTSSEAHSTAKASGKTSTTGANTSDVTKATTVVAFLITALNAQTGTLGLNVTDASA